METLTTLGTALGLTAMAGLNLYLTVFVTGLAIRLGWLQLAGGLEGLEVLGDPIILVVAGVLLVLELVIDKCPYADNGWDSIHTIIRPVGGAFLALNALGTTDPRLEIVAALLGGSIAFTSHAAKAGSRLMVNLSPEPATNIATSVAEDTVVLGGIWLAFRHPVISLVVVLTGVAVFWYFAPKFFRLGKANLIGLVQRFMVLRRSSFRPEVLPSEIPSFAKATWLTLQHAGEQAAWVLPCFSGRMKRLGRNLRGCLLGTTAGRLFFIGRKNFRVRFVEIPVSGLRATDDPGSVFHRVILHPAGGETVRLRFTRQVSRLVPLVMDWLEERACPADDRPESSGSKADVAAKQKDKALSVG